MKSAGSIEVSTVLADLWVELVRIRLGIETRLLARLFC
jgi:hypothetical protein